MIKEKYLLYIPEEKYQTMLVFHLLIIDYNLS